MEYQVGGILVYEKKIRYIGTNVMSYDSTDYS